MEITDLSSSSIHFCSNLRYQLANNLSVEVTGFSTFPSLRIRWFSYVKLCLKENHLKHKSHHKSRLHHRRRNTSCLLSRRFTYKGTTCRFKIPKRENHYCLKHFYKENNSPIRRVLAWKWLWWRQSRKSTLCPALHCFIKDKTAWGES